MDMIKLASKTNNLLEEGRHKNKLLEFKEETRHQAQMVSVLPN